MRVQRLSSARSRKSGSGSLGVPRFNRHVFHGAIYEKGVLVMRKPLPLRIYCPAFGSGWRLASYVCEPRGRGHGFFGLGMSPLEATRVLAGAIARDYRHFHGRALPTARERTRRAELDSMMRYVRNPKG